MPHKFILGQAVEYTPPRLLYAPPGIYVVTAKLPERDGEFEYYIKHTRESYERLRFGQSKKADAERTVPSNAPIQPSALCYTDGGRIELKAGFLEALH
jgi:hypothetical protein